MDLTDLIDLGPTEKDKEKERIGYFKNTLCPHLEAKFYPDLKQIKSKFFKNTKLPSYKAKCNVLAGVIEEKYEYCLCESYKDVTYKGKDYGNWVTFGSISIPVKKFPEFTLIDKTAASLMNTPKLIFSSVWILGIIIISAILLFNYPDLKTETEPFMVCSFLMLIFWGITLFIIIKIIIPSAKILYQVNNQEKIFDIQDYELGDKYAIIKENLTSSEARAIRKILNHEVCSNLLNIKSELYIVTSKDNCLHFDFDNEELTEEKSGIYVRRMLNAVKAFEQDTPKSSL
ncbi:MAG: hypothetical protein J6Z11_02950 [Candidatus Riflebacteria bacterium]|nr:hypothetical protein [Candidatus Riflebacteria bacterium]